ncbi:hypothetical protein ASE85_03265 [Sphingobium sp. Leaf26]|uniref:hypothetical protein n=1 Tax=Sphingobium sp. Leaf26 TaxID=1735693 RepID=UPI0006FAF28D|nr:hypothetical protein [Sphingobium sp. Leaf26]KQN09963.1 hypothetical protein ASE85_03265 [Sphingobium sp. Leaf26]
MSKFKLPKRVDADVAETGVWFDVYSELGDYYGKFKTRFFDTNSPKYQLLQTRMAKKYEVKRRTKVMSDNDFISIMFIEFSLLDWEVLGADDKLVPFTTDDAHEYFADHDAKYVLDQLIGFAMNVEFFQTLEPEAAAKK